MIPGLGVVRVAWESPEEAGDGGGLRNDEDSIGNATNGLLEVRYYVVWDFPARPES